MTAVDTENRNITVLQLAIAREHMIGGSSLNGAAYAANCTRNDLDLALWRTCGDQKRIIALHFRPKPMFDG